MSDSHVTQKELPFKDCPVVTCGHPDRRHCAFGMCRSCYSVIWQRENETKEDRSKRKSASHARKRAALLNDPEKLAAAREKGRLQAARWRNENREKFNANARLTNLAAYHNPDGKRKRQSRNSGFIKEFGITLQKYEEMHEEQGGLCAICGRPETAKNRDSVKRLAVDHCHSSGKVRGLLCQRCNLLIGFGEENADRLRAAIAYLEK